ncbi:hypothetical protein BV898_01563 [Hypsibius exemplaris]|uniref:CUB domain-containing protein n=1 Tax=Hypsibius exemplaris TaxID=2072580 RepID=A0A1W0XB43_HYPEX|nr:hypothetical protein BV898_01563 [Hypsibius exemplaris]
MKLLLFVTFTISVQIATSNYVYYNTYDLTRFCNSTLSLMGDGNRAGTLQFYTYPLSLPCTIKLSLATTYGSNKTGSKAIYFNVKYLSLFTSDYIDFNETSQPGKRLNGGIQEFVSLPQSYGQYRTSFSSATEFSITLTGARNGSSPQQPYLVLDYNIVYELAYRDNAYCSSLGGFVDRPLRCDTKERVNCPTNFSNATMSLYNPATSLNHGLSCKEVDLPSGRTTNYDQTTIRSSDHSSSKMSGGTTAGTVVGVVAVVGILFFVAQRSRRRVRTPTRVVAVVY